VRYEVRTPLNTAGMGLTLMQEEIGGALGYENNNSSSSSSSSVSPRPGATMPMTIGAANDATTENKDKLIDRQDVVEWFKLTHDVLNNAQSAVGVLNDLLNYDKIEMGALSLYRAIIK
jgi:signal transduction histidine kinase